MHTNDNVDWFKDDDVQKYLRGRRNGYKDWLQRAIGNKAYPVHLFWVLLTTTSTVFVIIRQFQGNHCLIGTVKQFNILWKQKWSAPRIIRYWMERKSSLAILAAVLTWLIWQRSPKTELEENVRNHSQHIRLQYTAEYGLFWLECELLDFHHRILWNTNVKQRR